MISIGFVTLLACLWMGMPALSFANQQHVFLSTASTPSRNYSIGFSLASSYGAAAVIIDDAYDNKMTHTLVVNGDEAYRNVMARLSLESSRHIAPPYDNMQDYFEDIPRVLARGAKKKAGLPASADVGVLAAVIKELKAQIESDLKIIVKDATLTTMHLEALYQDDVADICENAGFQYIIPKELYKPMLWETASAYAGYGFGLCEHWQNETQCLEENDKFPFTPVLSVHYSPVALTITHATVRSAIGTSEPWGFRTVDFGLGSDGKALYGDEMSYWYHIRDAVLHVMQQFPTLDEPVKVILTGDMVDIEFTRNLKIILEDHMGKAPPIYSDDALVAAARGAAEFRRRGQSPYQ